MGVNFWNSKKKYSDRIMIPNNYYNTQQLLINYVVILFDSVAVQFR